MERRKGCEERRRRKRRGGEPGPASSPSRAQLRPRIPTDALCGFSQGQWPAPQPLRATPTAISTHPQAWAWAHAGKEARPTWERHTLTTAAQSPTCPRVSLWSLHAAAVSPGCAVSPRGPPARHWVMLGPGAEQTDTALGPSGGHVLWRESDFMKKNHQSSLLGVKQSAEGRQR